MKDVTIIIRKDAITYYAINLLKTFKPSDDRALFKSKKMQKPISQAKVIALYTKVRTNTRFTAKFKVPNYLFRNRLFYQYEIFNVLKRKEFSQAT